MAHHELAMPIDEATARSLRVGDTVTLQRTLYGIRDATQIHLFDRGRTTRFDMAGHAVIHTAPNVRRVAPDAANPAGYAPLCVGQILPTFAAYNNQVDFNTALPQLAKGSQGLSVAFTRLEGADHEEARTVAKLTQHCVCILRKTFSGV